MTGPRLLMSGKLLRWLAVMVAVAVSALATPGTASATEYPAESPVFTGYASWRLSGEPLSEVTADWHVPAVLDCSPLAGFDENVMTAVWVGLSGDPSDSWLSQVGTDSRCTGKGWPNHTAYSAVWQLYRENGGGTEESFFPMKVSPGDFVQASVRYYGATSDGSQRFLLDIISTDAEGYTVSGQQVVNTPPHVDILKTAKRGWSAVEKSSAGLAKFDAFDITNYVVSPAPFPPGLDTYVYKLVGSSGRELAKNEQTSGTSWRVSWEARN